MLMKCNQESNSIVNNISTIQTFFTTKSSVMQEKNKRKEMLSIIRYGQIFCLGKTLCSYTRGTLVSLCKE